MPGKKTRCLSLRKQRLLIAALEDSGAKEAELTAALERGSQAFVMRFLSASAKASREAERTARQALNSEATLEALRA